MLCICNVQKNIGRSLDSCSNYKENRNVGYPFEKSPNIEVRIHAYMYMIKHTSKSLKSECRILHLYPYNTTRNVNCHTILKADNKNINKYFIIQKKIYRELHAFR